MLGARRRSWLFCLAVVLSALALGADRGATAQPEPTPAPATQGPAVEEPVTASAPVAPDELTTEIEQLRALLAGEYSGEIDVVGLLGVDPRNGGAVDAAVRAARTVIETIDADRQVILDRYAAPPEPQGGTDAEHDAGAQAASGDEMGRAEPGTPEAVESVIARMTSEDRARLDRLTLRKNKAELQLAFLSRPAAERIAAADAVEERRRLTREKAAAADAQREAEALAQQAELARQDALSRANDARSEAARSIAGERARLEQVRADIAAQRSVYAEQRTAKADADDGLLELSGSLEIALAREQIDPGETDLLYDQVIPPLVDSRREFRIALDERRAPSRYPEYQPTIDLSSSSVRAQIAERDELLGAIADLRTFREVAVEEERQQRWSKAETLGQQVKRLNDYRLALLPHLSSSKRERVLGIGPQGLGQLGREFEHTRLMARWTTVRRLHDLRDLPMWMFDTLGRASRRWNVIKLLAVLTATAWAYRRRKDLMARVNRAVRERTEGSRYEVSARRLIASFNALAVDLGLLVVVWAAFGQVLQVTQIPEVVLARRIVLTYAGYRFVLALMHRFFVSAASSQRRTISPEMSARIRSSVRLVAYYMFVVGVLLAVAEQVLGRGYLFTMVRQFFWIGAFPIAYVLLRRWRDDIFDAYLKLFPDSRLAEPLRKIRGQWYALLGVIPAVVLLSGRAAWIYLRNLALRFERTRKGLAYLFRRRLESRAVALGHGTRDVTSLPEDLRSVFTSDATDGLAVEHYPGLGEVAAAIRAHQGGDHGFAMALVGETGVGKTTWLRQLRRVIGNDEHSIDPDAGTPVRYTAMDQTLDTEDAVCRALSGVFEVPPCTTVDELLAVIEAAPRQVVMLDNCHNFVLRAVRGSDGFHALAQVLRRTVHRHVWVLAFSRHIWEYLVFAWRGQDVFDRVHKLGDWPEERIRELLDVRIRASGYAVDYEDLFDEEGKAADPALELERTRDRFGRLVWDYTDGIPMLALHFWMRSLVVEGDHKVRVRLFDAPKADVLERLQEQSRFVLTAVVTNEYLTLDEAVRVLQYPRDECLSILELLAAQGYLARTDGRYHVSTDYNRAVVRYLRRKHLLHS